MDLPDDSNWIGRLGDAIRRQILSERRMATNVIVDEGDHSCLLLDHEGDTIVVRFDRADRRIVDVCLWRFDSQHRVVGRDVATNEYNARLDRRLARTPSKVAVVEYRNGDRYDLRRANLRLVSRHGHELVTA